MSELEDAMLKHMRYLVYNENRPFSYRDFIHFEVDGKQHKMTHGTFRNKVSGFIKKGIAELEYKSSIAFYTLKGVNFGKKTNIIMTPSMTPYHMGVNSVIDINSVIDMTSSSANTPTICNIIEQLSSGQNSLHDIHLKFHVQDIWTILSSSDRYSPHPVSKDITLHIINTSNLKIRTTVHRTDTVTVVVACSSAPVATDTNGIIRLSNALTRLEERLSRIVDECGELLPGGYESIPIPSNETWIATMWHFGQDSPAEYTGPRFCVTWKNGQSALIRAYSKDINYNTSIARNEYQEYPQKKWIDAVSNKMVVKQT
ncbi:MAG TPA: hypothetical protein VIP70_09130 [Nitrososphaeraceae archaeon]